jgi:hypothetical protein
VKLFSANIWKSHFIKDLGSLLSTPKRIQPCVFISEAGITSLQRLPLATGYVYDETSKVAWAVIQKLKLPMEGFDQLVLLISERTYLPLDPLNRLTAEEKARIKPLKNIAKAAHSAEKSRVVDDNKKNNQHELLKTMFYILGFVMTVALVIYLIKK